MSKLYPFQSTRQVERAVKYENHTSRTGHVTIRRKPAK